jgi:hypothetical protein
VIRGFQLGILGVALLAAKRVIDLAMADQAIGHLGHGGGRDLAGLLQTAVAGLAGVLGIQVGPDIANRLQIGLFINRGGEDGGHISHLQVQGMIEEGDTGWSRRGNLNVLVTVLAGLLFREEIVRRFGAGRGGSMASGAFQFEAQVELMGKGRRVYGAQNPKKNYEALHPL